MADLTGRLQKRAVIKNSGGDGVYEGAFERQDVLLLGDAGLAHRSHVQHLCRLP